MYGVFDYQMGSLGLIVILDFVLCIISQSLIFAEVKFEGAGRFAFKVLPPILCFHDVSY